MWYNVGIWVTNIKYIFLKSLIWFSMYKIILSAQKWAGTQSKRHKLKYLGVNSRVMNHFSLGTF